MDGPSQFAKLFLIFQEFGADFSPYPKLKSWFDEMHSLPGFEENLEGAKKHVAVVRSLVEGIKL